MLIHIQFESIHFHVHSILILNPFLCLVLWLVLVFVNAPTGLVYAHFTADVVVVPLILDNTWKPSQVLKYIKGNVCDLVFFV